jgi:hypothetical protein
MAQSTRSKGTREVASHDSQHHRLRIVITLWQFLATLGHEAPSPTRNTQTSTPSRFASDPANLSAL